MHTWEQLMASWKEKAHLLSECTSEDLFLPLLRPYDGSRLAGRRAIKVTPGKLCHIPIKQHCDCTWHLFFLLAGPFPACLGAPRTSVGLPLAARPEGSAPPGHGAKNVPGAGSRLIVPADPALAPTCIASCIHP